MISHRSPISGVACFEDRYIATAGYDNCLILWDGETDQALAVAHHDHLVNQCQFSPDGKWLVSSSSDYSARLWSVPDLRLHAVLADHEDDVEGVAFHPTKSLIATASRDKKIRVFDFSGHLTACLSGHEADVLSVIWNKAEQLFSCSDDGTVRHWDVERQALIQTMDLGGIETDTIALTDTGLIFAGNDDGDIILIDGEQRSFVKAHQSGVKRLCYNADKQLLVSLSYDRTVSLWRVASNNLTLLKTTDLPSCVWARSADFFAESQIAFVTFGSQYALYDYQTDRWQLEQVKPTLGKNAVCCLHRDLISVGDAGFVWRNEEVIQRLPSLCNFLLPVAGEVLTGGQSGELINALTGEVIYQHHSPLNCAAQFNKEGASYVAVGTYTGEGLIFKKVDQGFEFQAQIQLHDNAIKGLACSKTMIFSVCATGAAVFYSVEDFSLQQRLPQAHNKIANGCAYLGNNQFASVSRDLCLRIFSEDSVEVINTPHKNSIKCLAISANKQWIATGDYRGLVAVYDCYKKTWQTHKLTNAGISCLIFDSAQACFQAASYDGEIYSVAVGSAINSLCANEAMDLERLTKLNPLQGFNKVFPSLLKETQETLVEVASSKTATLKERYAASQLLALQGDLRINIFAPVMQTIPSAVVEMGIALEDVDQVLNDFSHLDLERDWLVKETPKHQVTINSFRLAKYLVTNQEFQCFIEETGFLERPSSWPLGIYPIEKANHPVFTVSFSAAKAYAQWLASKTGRSFRLPTEAEWEYAASGPRHWQYPWGSSFEKDKANSLELGIGATTPVGIFAAGDSYFGLSDMAGNVEEYTASLNKPYPGAELIQDDLSKKLGNYPVCRGGSFARHADLLRTTRRHGAYPSSIYAVGFRLAESIKEEL